jgi:hypothetical protein
MSRAWLWVAVAVVLAAAVAVYVFYPRPPAEAPAPPSVAGKPAPPAPEPTIVPPAPEVPLPGLGESDQAVKEWLSGVLGEEAIARFLVPDSLVRKLVATVDNLPRKKLDVRVRVVRPLEGSFQPEHDGEQAFLGPSTYARYEPFMQVVRMSDPGRLADLYARLYPLLQQAYEELGYPGRQFHGRVLEAIDDLLETPAVEGPVPLVQSRLFYEFADRQLENRSAGQKTLLRIGPQHAAMVKEKLTAFRAEIVARSTASPQTP